MTRRPLDDRLRQLFGLPPVSRRPDEPAVPRAPRVRIGLVGAVPGAVVRLLPVAVVGLCGLVVGGGGGTWVVVLVAAVLLVRWPAWPVPAVLSVLVGLWVLAGPDLLGSGPSGGTAAAGGLLRVSLLVVLLHLLLRLGALSPHVPWLGWVEVAVLGRVARSVLAIQVVAQSLVLSAVWLRADVGAAVAGQQWLRVVAVLAVVATAWLVIPRSWLRPRPTRHTT